MPDEVDMFKVVFDFMREESGIILAEGVNDGLFGRFLSSGLRPGVLYAFNYPQLNFI